MATSKSIQLAARELEEVLTWASCSVETMVAAGGDESPVWVDHMAHQFRTIEAAALALVEAVKLSRAA